MARILTALALGIALSASSALAQEPLCSEASGQIAPDRSFSWAPPTEGSPVAFYRFFSVPTTSPIEADSMIAANPAAYVKATANASPTIHITGLAFGWWLFAVAGVDANGHQGPHSEFACALVVDPSTPIELPDPSGVAAHALSDAEVRVTWELPSHPVDAFLVASQEIPRGGRTGQPFDDSAASCDDLDLVTRVDGNQTSLTLTLPDPDTWYYVRVCSASSDGFHSPGVMSSAQTMPPQSRIEVFPNPSFLGDTKISFGVTRAGNTTVEVFTLRGELVRKLGSGTYEKGKYQVAWDGLDERGWPVASGTYVLRLTSDQSVRNAKFSIVR